MGLYYLVLYMVLLVHTCSCGAGATLELLLRPRTKRDVPGMNGLAGLSLEKKAHGRTDSPPRIPTEPQKETRRRQSGVLKPSCVFATAYQVGSNGRLNPATYRRWYTRIFIL